MKYDKLVRDKIPDVLDSLNKAYEISYADNVAFKEYLAKKLNEEVNEFIENPCIEELADIQEVVYGILMAYDWDNVKLVEKVDQKRQLRGAFSKGVILKEVVDP